MGGTSLHPPFEGLPSRRSTPAVLCFFRLLPFRNRFYARTVKYSYLCDGHSPRVAEHGFSPYKSHLPPSGGSIAFLSYTQPVFCFFPQQKNLPYDSTDRKLQPPCCKRRTCLSLTLSPSQNNPIILPTSTLALTLEELSPNSSLTPWRQTPGQLYLRQL